MRIAREQAQRRQLELVVERSDRSESVYLHVRRAETWFGVRIACHLPVYPCSADYQQLIVPAVLDENCRRQAEAYVGHLVRRGGHAVADPEEVAEAIEQARLERLASLDPALSRPFRELPAREQCAIRHRLNFRARWTYDEMRGGNG